MTEIEEVIEKHKNMLERLKAIRNTRLNPNVLMFLGYIGCVCPVCGEQMLASKFCPNCGQRLGWAEKMDDIL